MKKCTSIIAALLCSMAIQAQADYTQGLSVWFDKPTTLNGRAIWYGGRPDLWKGKNKPEWAGDGNYNADKEWESQSLPIGNGSIAASIMGSLEAERITFNEKTLWRGGPNTEGGADYYWNVNKESAHLLDDIRQAFLDGDDEKAAKLTRENFNSTASYEYYGEKPFRFGNFTTMGEFYIETGHSMVGLGEYRRCLSIDSALALVKRGLGAMLVPSYVAQYGTDEQNRDLCFFKLPFERYPSWETDYRRRVCLFYRKEQFLAKAERRFIESVEQVVRETAQRATPLEICNSNH